MSNDFNPENAVAVNETSQGSTPVDMGTFTIENSSPVDTNNQGQSPWDSFKQAPSATESPVESSKDKVSPDVQPKDKPLKETAPGKKEATSKGNPTGVAFDQNLSYPHESFLNATTHLAEGAIWNSLAAPFHKDQPDMDQYLKNLETKHPIASVIGGTAPFVAAAPFIPESLVPNIYARLAAQFGAIGLTQKLGEVKDQQKPLLEKTKEIAAETAKQAAFAPVFAKAQVLKILDRPFATALARSGIIAGGTGVMSTVFGENITEAFKQGGVYGVLSLLMESPHLAKTVIGRGVSAKVGINPEAPDVAQQAHDKAVEMAKEIPGIDKPQIIAAAIKLNDGTEIHGATHEDALNKINQSKEGLPKVSFKEDSKLPHNKVILDSKGNEIGKITVPKSMPEEGGFNLDINPDLQGKGYGVSALKEAFDQGVDFIHGDVGKDNVEAQKWWLNRGAKLNKTSDGNFKLSLDKKDFNQSAYKKGFAVQNPDGSFKFIDQEQSKQAPFNLPNGEASDVKGLVESKFMPQAPEIKIVNPNTLSLMENNEGKMDVNLIPGVAETAEVLQKSHAELREKFTPYEIGKEGKYAGEVLRENLGVLARNNDRLEESLLATKKFFDKATKESSLDFIHKMEEGTSQEDPHLQKIANTLRSLLDTKRNEVIDLGTGKLENWIENYFPHVWEDPNKVGSVIKRMMGKRPFEGTKSFLKKRTIPTTKEGIELGFTPVSYNPVDSVMLKVREMERYLMAHRTINALKEQGIIKFVGVGKSPLPGFVKIDDRFADVINKNDAGELVIRGKYYAQEDAARILNNYLSPGLAGKSYIYDLYRGAGNTLNQFQLGISAFHLGFTSMDATISKFALGINKLSTGNFAGATKEFVKAPFAPVTNILQGRELLQSWYGKDNGELTNTIADLMASAGGRAKMDKFYATGMKESLSKSIKEGKIATAAFKVPFYIVEQVARPIMEYIVPRQKMGVFMDIIKMELERNPNISHDQMRTIAQRAWNSVDNRMGQLVYDNLFWSRTTKDLAMASVRSLGWNLGTIREIGGGTKDIFSNVNDVIHGKATRISYRTAYVMALPIVTGLYGAIYQYLHTGQGPQEIKDYFFPKTGGIDNKGQAARISLPTYMKDLYHYTTNPVQTVLNKFSPVNNTIVEMMANKDFYGVQIRNLDDPAIQQILDESKFMASQFVPFGFRNLGRDTRKSTGSSIEPFIGITPAPYDINMTKAEKEAYEISKGKIPVGSRTKEQALHSNDKSKLRSDFMASKDQGPLNDAVDKGVITAKERKAIIKESSMTNLQRLTQHLTVEEVEHIMKKANPKETEELKQILIKKKSGKVSRGTWTSSEDEMYDKTFKSNE